MTPEIGTYPNVPAAEYHGWNALSRSVLEAGRKSMAHLHHRMNTPLEDTKALLIGRATHAAILEPQEFTAKYAAEPEGLDGRTKEGKIIRGDLNDRFGEDYVLKAADHMTCARMRDAVWANPRAKALLGSEGQAELSVVWDDAETGLRCKSRYDRVSWKIAGGSMVDLKTTRDASLVAFEREIFSMGYHRQGGMYLAGARARGIAIEHYIIIAVEKEEPHAVGVYRLVEGALEAGWTEVQGILRKTAECMATGIWPGYSEDITDITLPDWAWDRMEFERRLAS